MEVKQMKALFAQAGDTFFTRSNTILGRLIRWGETDPGETNGTWTNHTGVVVQSGWIGEPLSPGSTALKILGQTRQAIVIEALWHTRRGPLEIKPSGKEGPGTEVRLFRPVPGYTPAELGRFTREAEQYVGAKYGWWKLLVQLGDRSIFRGRKVLTTALFMDKRPICSYLAAKVNNAARPITTDRTGMTPEWYGFGMPPQAADPDEMMDFCLAHPELWEEVR